MPTLADFATKKFPFHPSQAPDLMQCPWKVAMKFVEQHARTSAVAADTGSAAHKAVSHWHREKKGEAEAIKHMRAMRTEYQMADLLEAEALFRDYATDPRNQEAEVVACEYHLPAQEERGHFFEGTLDQAREVNGVWYVWDYKTSTLPGPRIRNNHLYQVVLYAWLAAEHFDRLVLPGGIIRGRSYKKGVEAYYPYDLTPSQMKRFVDAVHQRIDDVRNSRCPPIPCELCDWCVGIGKCVHSWEAAA